MANYQVDADQLFSDSDEDGTRNTRLPSPKRPRTFARTAPSLGQISLTAFGRGRSDPVPRPSGDGPPQQSSFPSFSSKMHVPRDHPPRPRPHTRPRQLADSSLGPMGRGRSATLPAHVTRDRPVRPQQDDALTGAASILPEHQRERFLREQMKKRQPIPERKRPGARKRRVEQESSPSKRAQVLNNVANARKNGAAVGGLKSLMAAAGSSLIRLDPERSRTHMVSKRSAGNVYAAISVTKESREREERERKEEALRKEEERRRLEEEFGMLRQKERLERRRMSERFKLERTVAAGMRDAYTMARVENHLYGSEEDKERLDCLSYLGLQLVPMEVDESSRRLMTVEVIQI